MRARRLAMLADARDHAATAAATNGIEALRPPPGTVVSAFRAFGGEIDTGPLIAALMAAGAVIVLPRMVGKGLPLDFHLWRPGEPLAPGAMGVPEPSAESPRREPAILLVPLLAFDAHGHRLGYGGGYYDRTLRALRQKGPVLAAGFAFELQRVAEVPSGPGDERLDLVVTDAAVHDCRRSLEG
jgi:5-formyltetrahydrofolate cyclo-ligase